ncbi:MAG: HAD-IA family hydrolase, partial [Bacteroidota bacterium]
TVKDKNNVSIALMEALADEGILVDIPQVNQVMGYPKPIAIEKLLALKLPDQSTITGKYINEIHQNFVNKMIRYYQKSSDVGEKPGVWETFAALRESGIQIGIDTGFDRKIADTIFERLGWKEAGIFDYSVTSDEVANGRPYPDMIFKLMEEAGITDATKVAKVGDTQSDLLQGKAAGCALVIGVTTGAWKKDDLEKEYHTHLIAHLEEVLDIIGIHQPS